MSFHGAYHKRKKAEGTIQLSGSVMSSGTSFQLALGKKTLLVDDNMTPR